MTMQNDTLDAINRELMGLLELSESIPNGSYRQVFVRLAEQIREHFRLEQEWMAQLKLKNTAHEAEHTVMLRKLDQLEDSQSVAPVSELRHFVEQEFSAWLDLHQRNMDRALSQHIGRAQRAA